ncbi:ankyrin repeat and LEM domain-containing protein 2 homolog [Leptidea sinapis]|uniref:ankyrin repeat and LEM domain-containing protein 2 homolog n=1 Tax=Leptidea sinapis TaxID=189913 RepID=UPI0021C300FF|nr:ankyrin repeat and LEM domain-containing protein 2 homolog [Leptidea sinapis]
MIDDKLGSEMSKAVLISECNKDLGGVKDDICLSPNDKKDGAISLFSRLLRLDGLSKRINSADSSTAVEPPISYYGVYIPCEAKKGPDEEALHVYENRSEALELMKRFKLARLKVFRNRQDALTFALRGSEPTEIQEGNGNSVVAEKPYPFKAPSPQEMVALRKAIEARRIDTVRDRIWGNPRYLVSSGNTPAIVQEGSRYNALHVAAKVKDPDICNLILTSVGNPEFVQTLYGSDTDIEACKEFAIILLDLYLNTPDKAMNETPLHFASKFGAEEVVDVLTSFPQCNKAAINKHGQTPKDVICQRVPECGAVTSANIARMLSERYYVPVWHAGDGSAPPTVGRVFTPAEPPELNQDPLSPRYEIRAFAGPMEERDAESFRRLWRTPPRSLRPPTFRLKEITKGLETVGRTLAEQMNVGWKEYWPFLDTFTNLRSKEGLKLLEEYLKAKYDAAYSFAYTDNCKTQSPVDLSLSRITLNNTQNSIKCDATLSPMSELCVAMKTCTISDRPHWRKTDPIRQRLCRQPTAKLVANGETSPQVNHTVNQLLCIERTCQVFAKRIADALIFSLTAEPEVAGESLKSEAKHLQNTIHTYMDDERFKSINFALIHSRLAQLVIYKLKQQTIDLDDINNLVEFLVKLRCPNDDIFSSDDERNSNSRRSKSNIDGHVRCVSSYLCEELTDCEVTKPPAVSESECSEIWEKASSCGCDWRIQLFERNSKKNASFRKNRSILSTSPKTESMIRRLVFDHDIGDGAQQSCTEQAISVNSPAGDNAATCTLDVSKCEVITAEISEDDSDEPGNSDEEEYVTAPESGEDGDDEDEEVMEDATDRALAEAFIYGEEPTKMDRLVYDAISSCDISVTEFPYVFRWRHTIALYTPEERTSWVGTCNLEDSISTTFSPRTPCRQYPHPVITPYGSSTPTSCSTPKKDAHGLKEDRTVSLQVSNWLRVTGPNSPRSSLASKSAGHNVSFGF